VDGVNDGPRILVKGMPHQYFTDNNFALQYKEEMMIMKYNKIIK
jgi:hypothetical protein